MKILRHIFPVLLAVILLSSCSDRKAKTISRGDLAEIYAEMLMTDQWILAHPELRRRADTSLVYEPILNKYGYTTADYVHTMCKYMDDPERYSRILRATGEIFDGMLKDLEIKKEEQDRIEAIRKRLEQIMEEVRADLKVKVFYPDTTRKEYDHIPDSLTIEVDSANIYNVVLTFHHDSLIDGPRLVAVDTLGIVDSLEVADKLNNN